MMLYIVRHAIAAPHGTPGIADEDRELTQAGIRKMKQAAAGLCAAGFVPDLVLSSPLIRARQTAEILIEAFRGKPPLRLIPALFPGGDRVALYREIRRHKESEALMLVGHQPSLGEIAGEIAWGSAGAALELKKGGACALEIERLSAAPQGRLLWLMTPPLLRKLA